MRCFRLLVLAPLSALACSDSAAPLTRIGAPLEALPIIIGPILPNPFVPTPLAIPVGYQSGTAHAINSVGDIVGVAYASSGTPKPVRWSGNSVVFLSLPAGQSTGDVASINDAGVAVGTGSSVTTTVGIRFGAAGGVALPDLGFGGGLAYDINSAGTVVGAATNIAASVPVKWSASNAITQLALPAGYASGLALAINDAGASTGFVFPASNWSARRAVVWDASGAVTVLGLSFRGASEGTDIAPDGTVLMAGVVGSASYAGLASPPYASEALLFQGHPRARSSKGRIAGVSATGSFAIAYYWSGIGTLPVPAGSNFSAASGINTCGTMVGSYSLSSSGPRPVKWSRPLCDP